MLTDEEYEKFKQGAKAVIDGHEVTFQYYLSTHQEVMVFQEGEKLPYGLTYFKTNACLLATPIHHLDILKEFIKEAETNPEPWKAFEIQYAGFNEWEPLDKRNSLEVFNLQVKIRRIGEKKPKWQWLYKYEAAGVWIFNTTTHVADRSNIDLCEGEILLHRIEESKIEV